MKEGLNLKYILGKGFRSFIYIITIFGFLFPEDLIAQRKGDNKELSDKEIQQNADIALQEGKFDKALLLYRKLLEKDEKNPLLNFLVGYCYQNTDFGLEQSLSYLKKASEYQNSNPENKAPFETNYYLGIAYHAKNQFTEAIAALNTILQKTPKNELEFIRKLKKLINDCGNGQMLSQTVLNISIENLLEINSKYSDKNPLVFNQSNSMIFCSRRENKLVSKKFEDGQFDDNLYVSSNNDGNWTDPTDISQSINSIDNESACWISEDGKKMIIQRYDKNGTNLYLAQKDGVGGWNRPERLSSVINDGSENTFGSLSQDEKSLYFTSNRKGGYGGTDIYVSQYMGNNTWGEPKNLGPLVNTPFNEESPILHQTGVLYFSSEGHTSIGGFDIFASYQDSDGIWQRPVNMGLPINSIKNDFFYWQVQNGQSAYISSDREGTKGKSDIFKLDYPDSLMLTYGIVAGKIELPPNVDGFQDIDIIVGNGPDNKLLKSIKPTSSGDYNIILPSDRSYSLEFDYKGTPFYFAQIELAKNYTIACANQCVTVRNISLNLQNLVINTYNNRELFVASELGNENIKEAYNARFEDLNSVTALNNHSETINIENKYSIKLKNSPQKLPLTSFAGIGDVKEYQDKNGSFIYYFGEYEYEWEAEIKLKKVIEEFPEAVVFVFQKNL